MTSTGYLMFLMVGFPNEMFGLRVILLNRFSLSIVDVDLNLVRLFACAYRCSCSHRLMVAIEQQDTAYFPNGQAYCAIIPKNQTSLLITRGQERSPLQALRLFPNPAQDLVFLELDLPYSAPVRAIVQDAVGRQLAIADFAGQAGLQRFELRSAHWPPGTYWVSVIVDGHREVRLVEKF
jgi:hypothetical protein